MKKIYLLVIFAAILIGVYFGLNLHAPEKQEVKKVEAVKIETPTPVPDTPTKIIIPSLNVNATIESVAKDEKGNMDIPSDFNNTAWYNLGPKPGEKGSAVIDGHVDTPSGGPSVFAHIKDLKPGEKIETKDQSGKSYMFEVTQVITYDLKKIPLEEIFSIKTKPSLNLITCAGKWDKTTKTYSARTVVYSKLIK